jgi:hypothetical protein
MTLENNNKPATKGGMLEAFHARREVTQAEAQRRLDEDIANTEKFQRQTYSAVGGSPFAYIGASPTEDGGIDFDFAELLTVKANVTLNREQALALMQGIQNWFDME